MEEKRGGSPRREAGVREHLANERTLLLSCVGTGVGFASLGLVVEQTNAHPGNQNASIGASGILGVALAIAFVVYLVLQTFP